ncbi:hypothetical protein V8D89_003350 [Ganoderma adspersum]
MKFPARGARADPALRGDTTSYGAQPELLGNNTQIAQLQRLASQIKDIELLRLSLSVRGCSRTPVSWNGVATILRVFAAVASIRRLRLCCLYDGSYLLLNGAPEFSASAKELDPALISSEDNAFRSLRTVEFAVYRYEESGALKEHRTMFCAWVQRTLPAGDHCGGIRVQTLFCSEDYVFGPAGLDSHACLPDLPHAHPQGLTRLRLETSQPRRYAPAGTPSYVVD